MLRRSVRLALALAILVVSSLPSIAGAQESRGRAFARESGLPVRVIETGPAERRVRREFVPILTAEHLAAFQRTFGAQRGGVTLNFDGVDHLMMALEPGDTYFWARHKPEHVAQYNAVNPGTGRTFALRLEGEIGHLRGWLEQRAQPGDQLYCSGNCMEWLPNAEVGPGLSLFHRLGLRRSRDGRNMRAKLMHAANELVDVIGVHVASVDQFNAMSEQDLLGNPPAGGIDDSAR